MLLVLLHVVAATNFQRAGDAAACRFLDKKGYGLMAVDCGKGESVYLPTIVGSMNSTL